MTNTKLDLIFPEGAWQSLFKKAMALLSQINDLGIEGLKWTRARWPG
jgi:hypothetical protein